MLNIRCLYKKLTQKITSITFRALHPRVVFYIHSLYTRKDGKD